MEPKIFPSFPSFSFAFSFVIIQMLDASTTNPGPLDPCVLYDQEKHVSAAVWDGQERGALRCHEHTSKLGEWRLIPTQIELVERAGFGYLRKIPAISLDNPLISALVERWRRETNTFHFTVGEMTVTLQDVALMLGLAIDGKPVIGITHTTCSSVCGKYLGRVPDSNYASGGMVKLSWLKEFFSNCPEDASSEEVEQHTRAYLLYLVGSTIFSTTTGNKVPVMYLPLFEDFEEAGTYAWGAASLSFLYRALGNASVKSQSTICGCLTLLQCWSYYHLNIGRPKLNRDPIHDHFPFVLRWKGKQSGPTTNRDVVFYRKALDALKPVDVDWLPYKYMDSTVIPEDIKSTLILGRSKTMLICFDKAERHLPDRCLRQYGMLQAIPEDVPRWVRKSRGVDGGVDLSSKMEAELNEWADRRLHIVEDDENVDESEYMQWYFRITRKVVGRPISLSSEFQRTISGLRDIAYLADTFSTKGLDAQQFDSISRIRCIAQECLRDQVGSPVVVAVTPQTELGKRTRGKERVRRKGSGKRKRENDPMEGHAVSEDESQFCGALVEVDQMHLRQADSEVDHLQLSHAVGESDDAELCLYDADTKVDDTQLCDAANAVDESQLYDTVDEVNDSQLHGAAYDVNGSQLTHVASEVAFQGAKVSENHVTQSSEPCDATNEVNDSQICDATNEVQDSHMSDAADEVKNTQISDANAEVKNTQICYSTAEVNDSQTCDTTAEVNDSQICDPPAEVNDSQCPHGAGENDTHTTKVAEEVVPQSSLGTVEDVAKQGGNSVVV
ncbi:hypothetical protein ACOSP7_002861 [Xanthoceras sorbifolium]